MIEVKKNKQWIVKHCTRCKEPVKSFASICADCQKTLPPCKFCSKSTCGDIYGCCIACSGTPRGSAHE